MTHLTNTQLDAFRAGTLSAPDLLAVDEHLESCESCRDRLAAGLGEPPGVEHLSFEELQSPGEQARLHLAACAMCRREAEELAEFRVQIDGRRRTWVVPLATAAGVAVLAISASLWMRSRTTTELAPASIEPPAILAQLRSGRPTMLRGTPAPESFRLLAPLGTVVLSDRPSFRWTALPGAVSYQVAIYDMSYGEVARSPELSITEWQPTVPLHRGAIYSWQVEAKRDGVNLHAPVPPAPEARFAVLSEDATRRIDEARRAHASHLQLGLLYAHEGVVDLAVEELKQANAPSSLLRSLQ